MGDERLFEKRILVPGIARSLEYEKESRIRETMLNT